MEEMKPAVAQLRECAKMSGSSGFDAAKPLLTKLKICMTRLPSLSPGSAASSSPSSGMTEELLLVREVYELAVAISLAGGDVSAFERNMTHLKSIYIDYANILPFSSELPLMLGLNLMRLLSQNRIAEFHTELEILPESLPSSSAASASSKITLNELLTAPPIAFPMRLEQDLMEGAYPRIVRSKETMPHALFGVFLEHLVETVRREVADCAEKAYERIDVAYAVKVLMLDGDKAGWDAFCEDRAWVVDETEGVVVFGEKKPPQASEMEDTVPTVEVMRRSIAYAKELERIV
mmetsp:Transcript_6185/g.13203  ORF Transcript_6185/g.13203 Transcript_6185/m.13203 type:complete len:292 (+) Transcript_6185:45-920(+)|eukprot:CAMPEP_0185846498 /NCGR_PEP_ID=MMETSP1354-20130828/2104_1 /TAXON_ID=708628 /ORGANISM="Erythrolobus madagascarensis, Strain CCMP3276" /LENGTH=291 /DNA_ID=CAMNT_0028546631 /DNA_START=34 /DNA_END=909 /DNA_ORIENTATION=-